MIGFSRERKHQFRKKKGRNLTGKKCQTKSGIVCLMKLAIGMKR